MTDNPVLYESLEEGQVAQITFNRPDKFNCLSAALLENLERYLDQIAADRVVRVLIITGKGKHFCTGADLEEALAARASEATQREFIERGHRVLRKLEQLPKPSIAAVQGLALAGGIEVVLACDLTFMAQSARMGDQHAQFGLIPGFGGSQRLPRLIGRRRALELMYSARWLEAEEAREFGLANYVTADDQLMAETLAYAKTLASRNPQGLRAMKELTLAGEDKSLEEGLALEIDRAVAELLGDNVGEGLAAFMERRQPNFK